MLSLREYRDHAERLADHLPWAALVAPGVVLGKDGSFLRVLAFRGPDLESATEAELVGACARANNALKRFGSGWALFFEAERREALGYPDSDYPDAASWLVDRERRAGFEAEGAHFESRYHLTLVWLPPADAADRAGRSLVERPDGEKARDWRGTLETFIAETNRAADLLAGIMPEVRALDDGETLTFLHAAISDRRHAVAAPETPIYLDGILADTSLVGGLEPRLGELHVRTLTVLGFPSFSRPGILDALNHLGLGYRWVTRFIALDKTLATKTLTSLRRQWFNKRKSVTALLREVLFNQPAQLLDSDADNKVVDADQALQALGGDHVGFGYLTTTITVADRSRTAVEDKVRSVERIVNGLGFTAKREGVNAVEAWLSSLPGHVYANVRQPLVHTLNLAHLMPLSSVWAGPARNKHLGGPPLLVAKTAGSTPFRLSTHVGDVGHMMVVGPTGAGKSVLLSLIALQFRRYPGAQVYIFDKGNSARAAVLAMGGAHHALGSAEADGEALAFQPLANIDQPQERSWAAEWIAALIGAENLAVNPEVKDAVWTALGSLAFTTFFDNFLTIMVLLFAWALVIVAFFILAVQMFVSILEFKLTTLAGFILVPFALWNRTSFLAERVLGNVVSSGVKVMVLAVIVGIGSNFFSEFTDALQGQEPDIGQAMSLVLASLSLFGLGIFGPAIATGLVAGAPQLGAGAALGTAVGAAGVTMLAGGAAIGGARAAGGAALGAVRSGTAMGSAASSAYQLGRETATTPSMGAGLGGVARAAGNAARVRASGALGLSEAAAGGRQAAFSALNQQNAPSSAPGSAGSGGETGAPAWARAMRADQSGRHRRQLAVHALSQGDRGGASAAPDIKERND